jgi:hypothetical protein
MHEQMKDWDRRIGLPDHITLDKDIQASMGNPWNLTSEKTPSLYSNVEFSEDGETVEGTLDYTDERHCMLAYSSNYGHNFGIGFATDGENGCDKGLICDPPKYWRYWENA